MAETGKKAAESRAAESPPPNQAVDREAGLAVTNEAPYETPRESRNAGLRVRTAWPHTSFSMEDVPEIKAEGTMLTKTQYENAKKVAADNGVRLVAEEVE